MLDYKKVDLGFLNTAPIRLEMVARLPISADALFEKFEDENGWGWASIKQVVWETPKPFGPGTTRTVDIEGQGQVQEYFFLYEPGQRMAFRFEQGEMKAVNALVEDYQVVVIDDQQCELKWTIAMELRGILKLLTPVLRGVMRKQFSGMLDTLKSSLS